LADLLQFANAGDRPAITDRVRNVINDIQALACNRCVRRLVATIREQGGNYTTGINHIPEICSRDGSNYCLPRIFWAYSRFFWRSAALPNRVLPCLGNGCDAICQAVVNTVRQTPNVGCCGRAFLGAYDTFAKRRTALANLAQCQNIGDLPEICPGRKWLANVTVSNFDCSKLDALRTNVGNAFCRNMAELFGTNVCRDVVFRCVNKALSVETGGDAPDPDSFETRAADLSTSCAAGDACVDLIDATADAASDPTNDQTIVVNRMGDVASSLSVTVTLLAAALLLAVAL